MRKSFHPDHKRYFLITSVILVIIFVFMRGLAMLGTGWMRTLMPLSFVFMITYPLVLLTKDGRKQMGLKGPLSFRTLFIALLAGVSTALFCYITGTLLFGLSGDNWYLTIKNFYISNSSYDPTKPLFITFLIFTIPALIFSPIGEELFFRGFFQESLKLNFNERTSTIIECTCFGLIHLFHHGIVYNEGKIIFLPLSGILWATLMAGVAYIFLLFKRKSNSLYSAILCHAGFNLAMNYIIFYWM